jgi:hypothetical protein
MNNPRSFMDEGSRNSSLLIDRIEEDEGYLSIFTDLDTHIEEGDKVYILRNDDIDVSNSNLDNFEDFKNDDDFPFTPFNDGYLVLKVEKDKNKIVINKIFKETIRGINLSGHYVSLFRGENITFRNSNLNAGAFKNSSTFNTIILQGNFIKLEGSKLTFISKYDPNYISLKRFEQEDGLLTNQNNYSYGYNFVGYEKEKKELNEIVQSDIENGNFFNCKISSELNLDGSKKSILNGKYENCEISNYKIQGGYFLNCKIYENCEWINGTFENENGEDFEPDVWNGGTWLFGDFSGKTWKSGNFNGNDDTLFTESIWESGRFNNGIFKNSEWITGYFDTGTMEDSNWSGGTFNSGNMINVDWQDGLVNNGYLENINWSGGTFRQGSIINCFWYGGQVESGYIEGTWFGGILNNGTVKNSEWHDGIFNNGLIEDTIWYDGTFNNGIMLNCTWYDGTWHEGEFRGGIWYKGDWKNGNLFDSEIKEEIIWEFGNIRDCNIDQNARVEIKGGNIEGTDMIAISGITSFTNSPITGYTIDFDDNKIIGASSEDLESYNGLFLYQQYIFEDECNITSGTTLGETYWDINLGKNDLIINKNDISDIYNITGSTWSGTTENIISKRVEGSNTIIRIDDVSEITEEEDVIVKIEVKNRYLKKYPSDYLISNIQNEVNIDNTYPPENAFTTGEEWRSIDGNDNPTSFEININGYINSIIININDVFDTGTQYFKYIIDSQEFTLYQPNDYTANEDHIITINKNVNVIKFEIISKDTIGPYETTKVNKIEIYGGIDELLDPILFLNPTNSSPDIEISTNNTKYNGNWLKTDKIFKTSNMEFKGGTYQNGLFSADWYSGIWNGNWNGINKTSGDFSVPTEGKTSTYNNNSLKKSPSFSDFINRRRYNWWKNPKKRGNKWKY